MAHDDSPIAFSRTGNTGPALEKIEADALKAAPIPAEVREFASRLKAKTRTADTARAF